MLIWDMGAPGLIWFYLRLSDSLMFPEPGRPGTSNPDKRAYFRTRLFQAGNWVFLSQPGLSCNTLKALAAVLRRVGFDLRFLLLCFKIIWICETGPVVADGRRGRQGGQPQNPNFL